MNYAYEAYDKSGARRSGTIEAPGESQATERLYEDGLYVTSIERAGRAGRADAGSTRRRGDSGRGKIKDLSAFTRQLAVLCSTGTPLVEAMGAVERQLPESRWRSVVADVRRRVEEGESLVQALSEHPGHFGPIYTSLVAAGESGGQLASMLERLTAMTRQQVKIRQTLISACTYPVLLLCVSISVVIVVLTFVLPRFSDLFDTLDAPIPPSTKVLMSIGQSLRAQWWIYLGVVALLVAIAIFAARTRAGRAWVDGAVLRMPIFGRLTKSLITARMIRILGTLLTSRVQLLEALELTGKSTTNARYRELIDRTTEAVVHGDSMSSVIRGSDLIDPSIYEAIQTGERTGAVGPVLTTMADAMDEDNEIIIRSLTSVLEPVILIALGVVVGFVAISMFLPLFDLTSATQGV